MDQVITSFLRFKTLCENAHVELSNVRVIATEATRVAANAKVFLDKIMEATGWKVSLLSKQEEALISASGIVGKNRILIHDVPISHIKQAPLVM
jgi:retrograde regulation protein 2